MHDVDGVNAGYARLLLDEYLENPEAVPPEWRALFESGDAARRSRRCPGCSAARLLETAAPRNGRRRPRRPPRRRRRGARAPPPTPGRARRPRAARRRRRGDGARQGPPDARPSRGAARPARLRAGRRPGARPAPPRAEADARAAGAHPGVGAAHPRPRRDARRGAAAPAGDLLRHDRLRDRAHRRPRAARLAAQGDRVVALPHAARRADEQRRLYARLCEVEGMERYLRRSFLGQKQFSLEGLDVLIPMLDESLELAAAAGAHEVVIGMAHRGRLNVLAHTIGMPYEQILREFEGERTIEVVAADAEGGTGDVKYHLGARRRSATRRRRDRRHARREPEPPRGRRPGRRGAGRAPSRPTARSRDGAARPERRDADPAARRRRVRRPGRRRRDAQPLRARGLLDRRHAAPDHEQPGRLHDRPGAGPLDALLVRPRQGLRHADHPRQRRRPRGRDLGRPARARLPRAASATTSSSTSSATAASATTSRTRPPTRSR